jgi:hypothetical protein
LIGGWKYDGKGLQRLDKGSISLLGLVSYAMIYNSLCTCKMLKYQKIHI